MSRVYFAIALSKLNPNIGQRQNQDVLTHFIKCILHDLNNRIQILSQI